MSSVFSKRSPNEEQLKSILHGGGKLLSAGAGSGKTFVLIEHLIYKLGEIQKNSSSSEWNKCITAGLSKIVLMTFTKKAAGEMSVRMMNRVLEILKNAEDNNDDSNIIFWEQVRKNLSSLNITTIHGFCHRLLRQGFWSDFPQDINLVSDIEHKDKIQKLFDRWFFLNQKKLGPVVLAGTHSILIAMREIFSSPELRFLWASHRPADSAEALINQFFSQLIEVKGYGSLFDGGIDLETSEKEKNKKWYELLCGFSVLANTHGKVSFSNYRIYHEYFKSLAKFPPTSSKEISGHQFQILNLIREFRDNLKKLTEDLNGLSENFEAYKQWVFTITDLFQYINSHYFDIEGFSFSDLEYYALLALEVPSVQVKIQESFTYFIVDEFQDTSFIQFEILKKLIGSDSSKLFCVGDRKQAIYGFRGGELQVFAECASLLGVENNYFLKNNFRSAGTIIDYNNQLFKTVFPLGLKYEGSDPHSVAMESQVIPANGSAKKGEVVALRAEIKGQLDELDLDQLEALVLSEHIKAILGNENFKTICVLYRKLRPSGHLLELLLKNGIAFGSQVKIQFADDPLMNLFLYLVELLLNQNDPRKKASTCLLLETLLSVLDVKNFNLNCVNQFLFDQKIVGLRLAFHKFVFALGLTNSFHDKNAELIDSICRITREDLTLVYHLLKSDEGENYAAEMMSGDGRLKRIIIMSAHASKGLEFDAVLLGGIHTNGRYNGMKDHIGKFPHSFKWKKAFDQRHFFKSPFYHLESEILTLKDFSESKRLLYVACTRAVKHLAFVDLWGMDKGSPRDFYNNENSWIQALRLIQTPKIESTIENAIQKKVETSLLQRDSLGLHVKQENSAFGLIAELSVTRLATIAECPFKFYLQNICKIDGDLNGPKISFDESDGEDEVFYSSKRRGTEVHRLLSKLFLKEMNLSEIPKEEFGRIQWVWQLGQNLSENAEVISEKLIKFPFFGQMISGTPDLVFVNESENIVVWDFKTGIRHLDAEAAYWFQLMSYAYAYGNLKQFSPDKKIEISLLYIDQAEVITQNLSLDEITQMLFTHWQKTESLNQVNLKHCLACSYSSICKKSEKTTLSSK